MKPKTFSDAPGWEFQTDEVSANVFVVVASDAAGRTIEKTGTNPDVLLEECHQAAQNFMPEDTLYICLIEERASLNPQSKSRLW